MYAPYKPSIEYNHSWTKLHGYGNLKSVTLNESNDKNVVSKKYNHIERPEKKNPQPKNCLDKNLTLERLIHTSSFQNL